MTKVNLEHKTGKITFINTDNNLLDVTGFDPSDLMAAALAKCTESTVRRFATKNEYKLDHLQVAVELERDRESKTAFFKVNLNVGGDLSEQQLKKLQKIADKSYIRRLLSRDIKLESCLHFDSL